MRPERQASIEPLPSKPVNTLTQVAPEQILLKLAQARNGVLASSVDQRHVLPSAGAQQLTFGLFERGLSPNEIFCRVLSADKERALMRRRTSRRRSPSVVGTGNPVIRFLEEPLLRESLPDGGEIPSDYKRAFANSHMVRIRRASPQGRAVVERCARITTFRSLYPSPISARRSRS
jgi:hypothetical protein